MRKHRSARPQIEDLRLRHPELVEAAAGKFRELGVETDQVVEFGYGKGCRMTAFTMLKIAEVAPIPSARQISAAMVKPGVRSRLRSE